MPRDTAAWVATAMSTGWSSWTTPMAPRAYVLDARSAPGRRQRRPRSDPTLSTCRCHWPEASSPRDARATEQASGLAMNVGPCIRHPASPPETTWATSAVHSVADWVR